MSKREEAANEQVNDYLERARKCCVDCERKAEGFQAYAHLFFLAGAEWEAANGPTLEMLGALKTLHANFATGLTRDSIARLIARAEGRDPDADREECSCDPSPTHYDDFNAKVCDFCTKKVPA